MSFVLLNIKKEALHEILHYTEIEKFSIYGTLINHNKPLNSTANIFSTRISSSESEVIQNR
jgi:hypothetical protein